MKKVLNIMFAIAVAAGFVACSEQYTTYEGKEYLMFSDSISTKMILADGTPFKVGVSSTVARDFDRT